MWKMAALNQPWAASVVLVAAIAFFLMSFCFFTHGQMYLLLQNRNKTIVHIITPTWLMVLLLVNKYKGYSIFKSTLGGGDLNFFGGYLPPQFIFADPSLPAHFKFNITLRNTLCHALHPHFDLFNTPYPCITNNFQAPPPSPGNL